MLPILLHWVSAVLIGWLVVSGFRISDTGDLVAKADMLRLHVAGGISVAVLTLIRAGWWLLIERKPAAAEGASPIQATAARLMHWGFYVVVFGMAASGIAMMMSSGAGPIVFGGSGDLLPDFEAFVGRVQHGLGARLLIGLVALHIGAALYHQFILRDRILGRMGIGASS
nr:cytochrome b/b6 domain-containing protein [Rhodoplanes tepidamans]